MMDEDEVAILYRYNQLWTIVKHQGTIYQLATSEKMIDANPQLTWQTLVDQFEDAEFVNDEFETIADESKQYLIITQSDYVQNMRNKITATSQEIEDLNMEYEQKISGSESMDCLNQIRTEMQEKFVENQEKLLSKKLNLLQQVQEFNRRRGVVFEDQLAKSKMEQESLNDQIKQLELDLKDKSEKLQMLITSYNTDMGILEGIRDEDDSDECAEEELKDEIDDLRQNQSNILAESFQSALKKQEKKYSEWSAKELILWM